MKKIVTATLFLLLGFGIGANVSAKPKNHHMKNNAVVSLIPLHTGNGFAVMVDKLEPGKSMVIIYDNDNYSLFKDELTRGTKAEKKYVFPNLPDGNYTVEVFSKGHDIKTQFFVHTAGQKRIVRLS